MSPARGDLPIRAEPRHDIETRVRLHRAFWARRNERLLKGVVKGWAPWLHNAGTQGVWGEGYLAPDRLQPARFVAELRQTLAGYEQLGDDLFHAAEPFPGAPWLEAMAGCRVRTSQDHLWTEPVAEALEHPERVAFDPENPWVRKYLEFLDVYAEALAPERPVAQSVVRGVADVAAALLGQAQVALALYDEPERMRELLDRITGLAQAFLGAQSARLPDYHGGQVVGIFGLWAPGRALRLQDDAAALFSPELYRQFLAPMHRRLCRLSAFSVFHLHTTSLHVLPDLLGTEGLGAVQVSRDEGVADVGAMVPFLTRIQQAGRPLVVKGRFGEDTLRCLAEALEPNGLCIQVVVDTWDQAEGALEALRGL